MKKLIMLALIAYGAWGYYTKNSDNMNITSGSIKNSDNINITSSSVKSRKSISNYDNQPSYQCDGREHCSQMGSYEEAKFFIENCPNTKMDGDKDGVPCERQFGR